MRAGTSDCRNMADTLDYRSNRSMVGTLDYRSNRSTAGTLNYRSSQNATADAAATFKESTPSRIGILTT